MNKAERHRLKMKYYRRRLLKHGALRKNANPLWILHPFRTTGTPRTWKGMPKYSRKIKHKNEQMQSLWT